jgi:hypothetical protein
MKQITFITMATLLFAACQKEPTPEPQPEPDITPTISLTGTSWEGTYDDNYRGYPATLIWSLDFLTDSTCTLHFEGVIAAQPQPSYDDDFIYTLDGTEGTAYSDNFTGPVYFTYDSTNRTITWELLVTDGRDTLGGVTVFYPQGQQPSIFPVRTSWEAEQRLTVSDTLMPVEWGLDFWEYGWGGQINYCAGRTSSGTSFLWQYDSTTHSGSVRINGTRHPFTYDPIADLLTLDYSTHIYGTTVTIGGTLQFRRKDDLKKDSSPVHNGKTAPTIQNTFHIL